MTETGKSNLLFLITVIVFIAGTVLYSFISVRTAPDVYVDLLISEALVAAPAIIFARHEKLTAKSLGNRPLKGWSLLCLIGIAITITPLMSLLNVISSLFSGNAVSGLSEEIIDRPVVLNMIFIALLPALAEEFVFRGVIFHGFRGQGFLKAVLLSGLFFGLMHMNFNQFSYGFAMGIVFAVLVEVTGSLFASITVHFLLNFQTVALLAWYSGYSAEYAAGYASEETQVIALSAAAGTAYTVFTIAVLAVAAAVGTFLAYLLIRQLAKQSGREDYMRWVIGGGESSVLAFRPKEKIADVFFIAAVVLSAAMMVLNQIL